MNILPFQHRQFSGAESGEKADGNRCQQRTAFLVHRTCCEELASLRHRENGDRIVDLASFVDLLGGIALASTTLGRPSKKRPQMTDRRVAARRLLVFGEMFADLFFRDLVDIDFRRKSFR